MKFSRQDESEFMPQTAEIKILASTSTYKVGSDYRFNTKSLKKRVKAWFLQECLVGHIDMLSVFNTFYLHKHAINLYCAFRQFANIHENFQTLCHITKIVNLCDCNRYLLMDLHYGQPWGDESEYTQEIVMPISKMVLHERGPVYWLEL